MQEFFIQLAAAHPYLIYLTIVVLAIIEGPVLSMIFGVMIRLDFFPFWPVYIALMVGDLLGDVFWYYVGHFLGHRFIRRFGKYFSVTEENVEKVKKTFHKYKDSILFISKVTTGFGLAIATLITAGLSRIPFWRYMAINTSGQFIWSLMLISVGYFFSHLYVEFNNWLIRITLIGTLILLIAAFLGFRKFLRERLIV